MPQPLDVRRKAFAAFVRRSLRIAKEDRGWSAPRVAEIAGIGSATVYRWRDGDWSRDPSPSAVVAFCDALDIDPKHAFAVLWPSKNDAATAPAPAPLDRDIELLARRLRDPNVSTAEKLTIRATIRHLVGRANAPAAE